VVVARISEPSGVITAVQAGDVARAEVHRSPPAVDPHRIALAVRGDAERRPAQGEMAAVVRRLLADGRDGMVEAPTGVGKTYAILAAALDWLAAHPDGSVVVATHTKQLQTQLAGDLEAAPGTEGELRLEPVLARCWSEAAGRPLARA
jgi:superfamily II DNA or RNA helicase